MKLITVIYILSNEVAFRLSQLLVALFSLATFNALNLFAEPIGWRGSYMPRYRRGRSGV